MRTRRYLLLSSVATALGVALTFSTVARGQTPMGDTPPLSKAPLKDTLARTVGNAQPYKEGRIVVDNFRVAGGSSKSTGVMLTSPYVEPALNESKRDPSIRDRVEVHITSEVVTRLKNLGISNVAEHFKGKKLRVYGKRTVIMYTGFPASMVYTVTVDRLDDILVNGTYQ